LWPSPRAPILSMDTRVKPAYDEPAKHMPKKRSKTSSSSAAAPAADDQILASDLTLHDLFQRQTAVMLERADLSDEQKQSILIAMSCPCCGAGGMSFTAKLKSGV
jgi:hypothetical protein